MAGERELTDAVGELTMAINALTQRIAEMQVDLTSHRVSMQNLAAEINTLAVLTEDEQQRRSGG